MKEIKMRIVIIAAVLSLAACQPGVVISIPPELPAATQTVQVVSNTVVLQGTRGLLLAHNAYQGAVAVVAPLVRSGRLPAATVDRIERLNEQAHSLFSGADRTQSVAVRTAGLLEVANQLLSIGGR